MREVRFRCSSVGKLMTEPRSKSEVLSEGAKTYIRELVAQELFGVDFEASSKQMEKGIMVEPDSIALLNRVRGLSLTKNTERRTDDYLTGECDLFDAPARRGHDLKSAWSIETFPLLPQDCDPKGRLYEFQCRGYMRLWDAQRWEVNYALVNTPENLLSPYDNQALHFVDHIPEHLRLTTLEFERDMAIEASMVEKCKHGLRYYADVISEFDRTHRIGGERVESIVERIAEAAPAELIVDPFA